MMYRVYDDAVFEEMDNETLINESLEWTNKIRVAVAIGEGKLDALPQGKPGDPQHCVIANALSNGWVPSVDGIDITLRHTNDGLVRVKKIAETLREMGIKVNSVRARVGEKTHRITFGTPAALSTLIDRFDNMEIPELIEEEILA